MSRPLIAVVGSVNVDLICRVEHLPAPGETVRGGDLLRLPGGKGANQAVAAARLGAAVRMIGAVGEDPDGTSQLTALRAHGIDTSRIRRAKASTGTALIAVAADGENQIVVAPGANALATVTDDDLAGVDATLVQLEVPLATVAAAAAASRGFFALNAAPAMALPASLIERCDVVIVNERERAAIEGLDGARIVVVTYGSRGAAAFVAGREVARATPPRVEAIDTVGAGDAFCAALVVALVTSRPLVEALPFACAAGALATTRPGAQPALPTVAEVERVLAAS